MADPAIFTRDFTARPDDIDVLGHVNNARWVQWIQEVATAHWLAVAPAELVDSAVWVVIRHEIDYRRPLLAGEKTTAQTWVAEAAKGARFDRFMRFVGRDGQPLVEARTSWAMIDRASGRPMRVPAALVSRFREGLPAGSG